ncbi:MAG: hypothetical protein LBR37_01140 [Erysipelotrichaceae bacterium]|jgi:hypothetical protein|nr:hypothetical protein [Erysipelotrichaceae bacterium]
MLALIKTFGKGLLYIIALPFFVVAIALGAVLAVFVFIYLLLKSIITFFKGRTIFTPLAEEVEANRIININQENQKGNIPYHPEVKETRALDTVLQETDFYETESLNSKESIGENDELK